MFDVDEFVRGGGELVLYGDSDMSVTISTSEDIAGIFQCQEHYNNDKIIGCATKVSDVLICAVANLNAQRVWTECRATATYEDIEDETPFGLFETDWLDRGLFDPERFLKAGHELFVYDDNADDCAILSWEKDRIIVTFDGVKGNLSTRHDSFLSAYESAMTVRK